MFSKSVKQEIVPDVTACIQKRACFFNQSGKQFGPDQRCLHQKPADLDLQYFQKTGIVPDVTACITGKN